MGAWDDKSREEKEFCGGRDSSLSTLGNSARRLPLTPCRAVPDVTLKGCIVPLTFCYASIILSNFCSHRIYEKKCTSDCILQNTIKSDPGTTVKSKILSMKKSCRLDNSIQPTMRVNVYITYCCHQSVRSNCRYIRAYYGLLDMQRQDEGISQSSPMKCIKTCETEFHKREALALTPQDLQPRVY